MPMFFRAKPRSLKVQTDVPGMGGGRVAMAYVRAHLPSRHGLSADRVALGHAHARCPGWILAPRRLRSRRTTFPSVLAAALRIVRTGHEGRLVRSDAAGTHVLALNAR